MADFRNKETPGGNRLLGWIIGTIAAAGILMIAAAVFITPRDDAEKTASIQDRRAEPIAPLPEKPHRSEILFGCSISKSGIYVHEARRAIEGYDLWAERVNRKGGLKVGGDTYPVRILYYDDKSSASKVRENITRLITEDRVDFLLGPFSSGLTLAASEVAGRYGVKLVETCGASEVIFSKNTRCTFAALTSASWYTRDFFKMLSSETTAPLTYAVLARDKLFPKSVAKGSRIWGEKYGFTEVYYKVAAPENENMIIFLEEIAEKSPDIVLFAGHYQDSVRFVEQLSTITDYHPKAVVMTLGPTQKNFVPDLGKKAEYMTGISQWSSNAGYKGPVFGSSRAYARIFEKRYGHRPTYQNAQATAGCVIYQLAIEKCPQLSAEKVLLNIRQMDTELFYGKIRFDKRGLNIGHPMVLVQIQNGKPRLVWPESASDAEFIYPMPPE